MKGKTKINMNIYWALIGISFVSSALCDKSSAALNDGSEKLDEIKIRERIAEIIKNLNSFGDWKAGNRLKRDKTYEEEYREQCGSQMMEMCPVKSKPFDKWLENRGTPQDHTCPPDEPLESFGPDCNCHVCTGEKLKDENSIDPIKVKRDTEDKETAGKKTPSIVYDPKWRPSENKKKKRSVSPLEAEDQLVEPQANLLQNGEENGCDRPKLTCQQDQPAMMEKPRAENTANTDVRKHLEHMAEYETHPARGLLEAISQLEFRDTRPMDEL